jgi:hypothetical protein
MEVVEPAENPPADYKTPISLHCLMKALELHDLPDYRNVSTGELERACDKLDDAQLHDILDKYIGTEDMYTQQYLHGVPQNIQLLADIGNAVQTPEGAAYMIQVLNDNEPLFVRTLKVAFRTWYLKTSAIAAETANP